MMEVNYKVNNKLTVTFEAEKMTDLIEGLSNLDEICHETQCGKKECKSTALRYNVRKTADDDKYYEIKCLKCHAAVNLSVHRKGGKMGSVYLKRKDKEGNWLPDNGWLKWDGEKLV